MCVYTVYVTWNLAQGSVIFPVRHVKAFNKLRIMNETVCKSLGFVIEFIEYHVMVRVIAQKHDTVPTGQRNRPMTTL
jgi:hypothetical protein